METQVGQLALNLQNQFRDSFLNDTKKNPKDCMTITLSSGKELQVRKEVEKRHKDDEAKIEEQNQVGSENKKNKTELTDESDQLKVQTKETVLKKKEEVRVYQPPIPFPQRLKLTKMDNQFAKFMSMFRKLEINIPFVEALAQRPHYAKFMKDIISKKRKLDENEIVSLSANYSAIIMKKFP